MKCHRVEYYSEENNIKNPMNTCSFRRIFLNLLSIVGILLLVGLNVKYNNMRQKRNLSELKSIKNRGLRSTIEKNILKNTVYEKHKLKDTLDKKNYSILPSSVGCDSKDGGKYNDDTTKEKSNNINYNDLSKQLTLEELRHVLDNFKKSPSNQDLYNIWNHALGIAKEGFHNMVKELELYIRDYLNKYEYQSYHHMKDRNVCIGTKYPTWYKSMNDIGEALSSTDRDHTRGFYGLVKDKASIDEIKNFIYSYIEHYDTLKNELYNEHKKRFTERMNNPK
ncbi:hypothetical protein PFUGPA_04975 [Plasmodium falciparum Palo Alto/Uganda]|uniref:Plasmodium RESA N-terminal domain-containing protein n=6 Tax=Plasmodium falciparum TaxID=5833 RepID=W7KJN0_PLAFO|nr:hypothetical protein PFNF135_01350 [Plasmodium falciparum NF135/5.C10]ETW50544.1 hypothetical protein PFMALIP_01272 [Plasmodium falciparum MaliPS096_E11]ETW53348.1 hypothetical protein PFUGPA_04975 [Plasmodium falciparum Palo Alto/Uganda]ETW62746.1 hypothetical protein PFMC_01267 [Plasmodium falciparum CAMP/Malaysia]EWC89732.1 hypothetical protein PFNF54_01311 [Plasmodium falciparum NF54]